ncbi:MAG: metal ABC transporter substrate-binding protein [Proteobacteria bacterium]|nr:metal ABC transporter substrate-binding protein [Pseudomonadota bacterium]
MSRLRFSCIALLACLLPQGVFASDKIKVVASFSILGDIVKEVGGERIELTTLVGPGGSVHQYEPTPDAIKAVGNADLVIVNGINYENWMGRLVVSSGYSGQVVVAAKDITPLSVNDKLDMDPHAWHSVSNVKVYVANIRDALIEMDRRNSAKYKENAERFTEHLNTLEGWIKAEIAQVDESKRAVITAHNAFQYFGRYYGVRILSVGGTTHDSVPSAAELARAAAQIRAIQKLRKKLH